MHIQLTDSLNHEQTNRDYEFPLEFQVFNAGRAKYTVENASTVKIRVTKTGAKELQIKGSAALELLIPCDRCLEKVRVPFELEIERHLTCKEGIVLDEESEEQPYIEGYTLDVDALVRDELFVNMPMKVLCRDDCKGICNRCGANLNYENCGCDVTELDPRMAVIRDIFRDANQ